MNPDGSWGQCVRPADPCNTVAPIYFTIPGGRERWLYRVARNMQAKTDL